MLKRNIDIVIVSFMALELVAPLCPTLGVPMDCSPPGSSVYGILQARILKWVAIRFSGDLPEPGIEPKSPALQADSLLSEPQILSAQCSSHVQVLENNDE